MSDVVKVHASRAAHAAGRALRTALGHEERPLTADDEAMLAARFDEQRGFGRPMGLRSKEAYEHAENAPILLWHASTKHA